MQLLLVLRNIINNVQPVCVVTKTIDEDFILFFYLCISIFDLINFSVAASSSIWDVTVRIYIGCEYECPRGHRFMCSSPNHIIRVGPNGVVKVRLS